jgi:hypothetical protein
MEQHFGSFHLASPKLHLSTNDKVHSPSFWRNAPYLLGEIAEHLAEADDSSVRRQKVELQSRLVLQSVSVRCAIHNLHEWPIRLLELKAEPMVVPHSFLFTNLLWRTSILEE